MYPGNTVVIISTIFKQKGGIFNEPYYVDKNIK